MGEKCWDARCDVTGWPRLLLPLAVCVLAVATGFELVRQLHSDAIDHTVGVYVLLAELARQGVVYPPLQTTDLVYCTLYQPLAFLPYALLPGSGLDLIVSMRVLVRIEVVLSLVGVVWLLRRCGASAVAAWTSVGVLLCASPVSAALLLCIDDPRGGLLAMAAFLVFVGRRGVLHPFRAAPVLVLAFLTKLTAPCAVGVAALALCCQLRRPRALVALLGASALGTLASYLLAHGPLGWDLAGNGLRYALFDAKPGRPIGLHVTRFIGDLVCDPVTALLLFGGAAATALRILRHTWDALDVWFLVALLRAFVEYGSHGTELNHLLEPCLLGAVSLVRSVRDRHAWLALAVLPAAFLSGRPVLRLPLGDPSPLSVAPITAAVAALRAQPPAKTLCEEPLLGWLSGSRPLVTDPFLVSRVFARHPEIRDAWFSAKDDPRALQRLVLMTNPDSPDGRAERWYGALHFDAQFLADVRRLFVVVAPSDFGTVLQRK